MNNIAKRAQGWVAIAAVGAMTFTGCNGVLQPQDNTLKEGALTADFASGGQYTSSIAKAKLESGNVLISSTQDIIGSQPDEIYLIFPAKTGTSFTVTPSSDPSTLIEFCQTTGSSCNQYYGKAGLGSATITVTDIVRNTAGDPVTLKGSFSGRLIQRGVADSVRTITDGAFNVRVQ